jgi:hypothetical protein
LWFFKSFSVFSITSLIFYAFSGFISSPYNFSILLTYSKASSILLSTDPILGCSTLSTSFSRIFNSFTFSYLATSSVISISFSIFLTSSATASDSPFLIYYSMVSTSFYISLSPCSTFSRRSSPLCFLESSDSKSYSYGVYY